VPSLRGRVGLPALVLATTLIATSCGAAGHVGAPTPSVGQSPSSTTTPPTTSPPVGCVGRVLSGMTEAQRVGQLFMVGLRGGVLQPATAAAFRAHHFGSATFISTTTAGVDGVLAVTDAVQALASQQSTAGVRFFVSANQEGGEVQALQGPGFSIMPPATQQGMLPPPSLRHLAFEWGRQMRAAGVNLNLAPVMDVVPLATASQNQPIGALHREFGYDPVTVASHGVAFIHGMTDAGIATTAKHFPGLGRVVGNTDFTANVVDRATTATDPFLASFRAAIAAGVPFVMVSLATYARIDPSHLAVFSPTIIQTMLRDRFGFRGVVVSDDLGAAIAVAGIPPGTRAIEFLEAGGDLITSKTVPAAVAMDRAVLLRARADGAFRAVIDAAATRILTSKERFGLLPCSD